MLLQVRAQEGYSITWLKKSEKFGFGDAPEWVDDQVEDMIGVGQGGELVAFMDHDFVAVEAGVGELAPQFFGFFSIGHGDDDSQVGQSGDRSGERSGLGTDYQTVAFGRFYGSQSFLGE